MIGQAPLDDMTYSADFEKFSHSELSHLAFATLDAFMKKHNGEKPTTWSITDASNSFPKSLKIRPNTPWISVLINFLLFLRQKLSTAIEV